MTASKPEVGKKYFTVGEANSTLPLVRAIVRDVTELARDLRERHERFSRMKLGERGVLSEAHHEEVQQVRAELERDQERMQAFVNELEALGVELKDYFTGLVDFPAWLNGRPIYLCWRLGEPEVGHWHDLDAGFAGRQKLMIDAGTR